MPKDSKENKAKRAPGVPSVPALRTEPEPAWNPERFAPDATRFKALGDPTRLAVMAFLLAWDKSPKIAAPDTGHGDGATVTEIACALTGKEGKEPSALSHHLKELLHAGLVTMTRHGKNRCYGVALGSISPIWERLLCGTDAIGAVEPVAEREDDR